MLEEGPTEVSGVRDETECPADHWDQEGKPCYVCGAQV
jgi:hypothetical protein